MINERVTDNTLGLRLVRFLEQTANVPQLHDSQAGRLSLELDRAGVSIESSQLRAHLKADGVLAEKQSQRRHGEMVIYEALVKGKLEAPKHVARSVNDLYFEPEYEDFRPRTIGSLSNAFTSAFRKLDSIPQIKATAKLGEFLEARFSQSL